MPKKTDSGKRVPDQAGTARTDLFFKVEVEHDQEESPERLGAEICRQIQRIYGVRVAELTHFIGKSEQ